MKNLLFALLTVSALLLAGCGGDKDGEAVSPAIPAPSEPGAAVDMSAVTGGVIDHSRDEKEFELRRAIGGLERMIEQYQADGYDASKLEKRKRELSAELNALLGA